MNARKVNKCILDMFSRHVDVEDIYVTHTIEQSDKCLDEIIEKKYPLVLCGGGDGTVMRIIEQMHLKVKSHNDAGGDYVTPKFGILRLGTGNAWAGLLDVPKGIKPIWEIRRFTERELAYKSYNIIQAEERMFHIGGFGIDALILNDYIDLKKRFTEGVMWKISNTLAGYLVAILFKSLPNILLRGFKLNARIINESEQPVYKVSHSKGAAETAFKKGDTIYEGPADAVIFGTTSDYGFKLRVLPYAMTKCGCFNLRICNVGALKMLRNIRSLWRGTFEHPGLHDFLVEKIKIEIDQEAPFQLGGDPEGYRRELHLNISDFMPEVLDFGRLINQKQ